MLVREAKTLDDLRTVWRITHDAYVRRDYIEPKTDGLLSHHPELDLIDDSHLYGATTVYMVIGPTNDVIGTVSCTYDTERGLHTDGTFWQETERERDAAAYYGHRLGSVWRIETTGMAARCVIGELLDAAYEWAMRETDVVLCTFHPRHARLYGRLFGFDTLARQEAEDGLHGAPSVLMRWDRSKAAIWKDNRRRFYCSGLD